MAPRPQPRAKCPDCQRWVAVKTTGRLRNHGQKRANAHTYGEVCPGSGKVATEYYEHPLLPLRSE